MFCSNSCVLYFIITCSINLRYTNGFTENILEPRSNNPQISNEEILIIDETSFNKGKLTYARCGQNSSGIIKCNIVEQSYIEDKSAPKGTLMPPRNCSYTIRDDRDLSNLNVRMVVIGDKVILSWGNDINIGVFNLNTCTMGRINRNGENYFPYKVVPHADGSFDVFFNNQPSCGEKLCRVQFRDDGTIKKEPIVSNIPGVLGIHHISHFTTRSSSEAYVYLKKNEMDFTLLLTKDNGTEKQLAKYDRIALPAISVNKNVVSACAKFTSDSEVTCTQYDGDGNIKFTATIVNKSKNFQPKVVYNLPDGGILVMLAEIKQSDKESNHNINIQYSLVKIDANGKILGTTRTEEINDVVKKFKYAHIYEKGDSGYCAFIVGENTSNDVLKPDDVVILVNCYAKSAFSI